MLSDPECGKSLGADDVVNLALQTWHDASVSESDHDWYHDNVTSADSTIELSTGVIPGRATDACRRNRVFT